MKCDRVINWQLCVSKYLCDVYWPHESPVRMHGCTERVWNVGVAHWLWAASENVWYAKHQSRKTTPSPGIRCYDYTRTPLTVCLMWCNGWDMHEICRLGISLWLTSYSVHGALDISAFLVNSNACFALSHSFIVLCCNIIVSCYVILFLVLLTSQNCWISTC